MKTFDIEVPCYLSVRVRASDPETAAAAATSLVEDLANQRPTPHEKPYSFLDGTKACLKATRLVLLGDDEDKAPDVYELVAG